jgi:signal transduction histidine kinase
MRRPFCRRTPPWWPAGEPWPPRHGPFGIDAHARARFFRRIALVAGGLLALAIFATVASTWMIAGRFGVTGWAAGIPTGFALLAAAFVLTAVVIATRGFAFPLGAVMDAADHVAGGDYGTRVREHGSPPMRALARSFNTMTERLQHADRLRRDLMADVAHELRTPLSVLHGRLEGLLDGVYPRDDQQITQLLEETRVLSRLIEDLRILALSDAGALPLQKEATDVLGLVREVLRSMQSEATHQSVALNVVTSFESVVIDLDPLRIREVLTNLLSNALRHTTDGQAVTVSVALTAEAVTVAVSDTGAGMPPDEVARMFDRFYKGATSRGSGLGLTIAKGIVTAQGGDITASSQVGKGTVVTFSLPRSQSA